MILKIQPQNPNFMSAIIYNEKKMNGVEGIRSIGDPDLSDIEDGHILATRNVPEGRSLSDEFERLKFLNFAKKKRGQNLKNLSFHMSVNPSDTDKPLSEKEAVDFIDEVMKGLGYEKQPYRIYKHTDIKRTHYHVVSCRAGQDGLKIDAGFERLKLRSLLKDLSKKYGFTLVLTEEEMKEEGIELPKKETPESISALTGKETKKKENFEDRKHVYAFSRKSNVPVKDQIKAIAEEVLNWHFTTFEQIQALMLRRYNVSLELQKERDYKEKTVFSGTDENGVTKTPFLDDEVLGVDFYNEVKKKIEKEKMYQRKDQRNRLEALAKSAIEIAKDYDEYVALMKKKGIIVAVSWSEDGRPFGVTYLDTVTKCAWKGSETHVDLKWMLTKVRDKGWEITKEKKQEIIEKRNKMPSRRGKFSFESKEKTTKEYTDTGNGNYLPGHHEESRAKVSGDLGIDDKEDKPTELVQ